MSARFLKRAQDACLGSGLSAGAIIADVVEIIAIADGLRANVFRHFLQALV